MDTETDPRSCPFGSPQKDAAAIIGIGASAGGSAALETFFENCPAESGTAFVVIQDIPTKHESLTADLLAQRTRMSVEMIETDTRVRPDHVYLNPPGAVMRIEKGVLRLTPCDEGRSLPIDSFFTSLAEECGDRASGILLSGTGSDGTRGASAIYAAGGLVLIQHPGDAHFDGTPMSLRRAGIVDAELPVTDLARRALAHRQRSPQPPFGAAPTTADTRPDAKNGALPEEIEAILQALEEATGTDFRRYKSSTLLRRIGRRMQLLELPDLQSYVRLMQSAPGEVAALTRELLISVTRFFRDEDAFRVVEDSVTPRIVETLPPGQTARVWVAGCATGEEAYSIAILLHEAFHKAGRQPMVKVFATDINPDSLQFASAGSYPASVGAEIGTERLKHYFHTDGDRLQVTNALRQSLVFARHDLLCNPPFTRIDLVSCRNTLIYFRQDAQKNALLRLQYAIRKSGYLFLGSSETLSGLQNGFQPVDARHKVFVRGAARPSARFNLSALKSSPPFDQGQKARHLSADKEIRPSMQASAPRSRGPLRESPGPQDSPKDTGQVDLATAQARIDSLESDLDATRADLEATIQELETSNEELQSVNEELIASIEALQGSNHELQSVNEEINTVNAEYQEKMALMNRLDAELNSMIQSVGVATVFLDEALLITRFSPEACSVFKLRESDIGQPLGDIAHKLKYPALQEDIRDTIRTGVSLEREAAAEDGALYRVRITPYAIRSSGHRGAVVTLRDVTVHRDLARLQGAIDALPEHVAALDVDGTILLTNKA
ncbi:PAS domain-containing protein [Rhodovulum sulfidophilum]|uniref:CheR family methyltransferase n=1 Tax=Rhodovulum sulfidophilum TaxID=35806 RepID=UPI0019206028|nr:CheR family methyltransferase [Rhodovulum sulfidophilum]MBL3597119.1 PAS domain-containing protein [Rhodovulum sulfidophilum]